MFWLAAAEIGVWHERTAVPFRCTVHAPHWPIPQPYLVPFRLRTSRTTHSSGVSAATSTVVERPFTLSLKAMLTPECESREGASAQDVPVRVKRTADQ